MSACGSGLFGARSRLRVIVPSKVLKPYFGVSLKECHAEAVFGQVGPLVARHLVLGQIEGIREMRRAVPRSRTASHTSRSSRARPAGTPPSGSDVIRGQSACVWNSSRRDPASSRTVCRNVLAAPTERSNATSARCGVSRVTSHRLAGRARLARFHVERGPCPRRRSCSGDPRKDRSGCPARTSPRARSCVPPRLTSEPSAVSTARRWAFSRVTRVGFRAW